jgi:hypothetical protein
LKKVIWHNIPIAKGIKYKTGKWNCITLNSFCISRKTITTMKRQSLEWKKIFSSYYSDEGLITTIYKDVKNSKEPISRQMI